jgi:hypothetical protein
LCTRGRPHAQEAARTLQAVLQRFYPGYDEYAFRTAVEALLARERQDDMDLLASLEGGTQVIHQEELEQVDVVSRSQSMYSTVPDMAAMETRTAEISAILDDLDDLYDDNG